MLIPHRWIAINFLLYHCSHSLPYLLFLNYIYETFIRRNILYRLSWIRYPINGSFSDFSKYSFLLLFISSSFVINLFSSLLYTIILKLLGAVLSNFTNLNSSFSSSFVPNLLYSLYFLSYHVKFVFLIASIAFFLKLLYAIQSALPLLFCQNLNYFFYSL